MPLALFMHCTVIENSKSAIVMAGATFGANCVSGLPCGHHQLVYSYNRYSNTWTREPDMPAHRRMASCMKAVYRGREKVLVAGGLGPGQTLPDQNIFSFDLFSRSWSSIHPRNSIPLIRGSVSGQIGREIYFVGGWTIDPSGVSKSVYSYNIDEDLWEEKTDIVMIQNFNSQYSFWLTYDVVMEVKKT